MDQERRKKLEEALADVVHSVGKEHHSPAAVAGQLATSLQLVAANFLDELGGLSDRVKLLEDRVADLEDQGEEDDEEP
jgi:hypothetical protein